MTDGRAITLLGYAASINVRKVLWVCEEIGILVTCESWGGPGRSTSEAAFRSMNPVGLVPVIDDGGTIVWESNSIIRYLASSRGRNDLLPRDPTMRAHVEMWMDWQGSDFNNTWRYAFQSLVRRNPAYQDSNEVARSINALNAAVGVINHHLAKAGPYMAGPNFTVADISIGLSIHRWRSIPMDRQIFSLVDQYYELLCDRAGFRVFGRDGGA